MGWREFWDGDHSIYVNARHKTLHYERIGHDIEALLPAGGVALDHGAGEALSAPAVARRLSRLNLHDSAPNVRARVAARFAGIENISVLDEVGLAALPQGALDAVVVNSMLQYVPKGECGALLNLWADKLKPGGRLILGDVIPPGVGAAEDVVALLKFAVEGRFVGAALVGLAKTFFSPYRALRAKIPLVIYGADEMLTFLSAHGFEGVRAARNIGHNQARMTFVARRR